MFDPRTKIYAMRMSGKEAYTLAMNAVRVLRLNGHAIRLNDKKYRGFATNEVHADGNLFYEVGIKEIKDNPRSEFSIYEAISPIVACFHEVCGHGGQWRYEAQKNIPLSRVLLLNDIACKNSWAYYGMSMNVAPLNSLYSEPTRRYFDQPHEIAAQYMALKMTHRYLTAVYGEDKATAMVTQYVNIRMGEETEYISMADNVKMEGAVDYRGPFIKPTEPYKTMSEVYDSFQETFVQKVFETPEYKVPKNSSDFVSKYINEHDWPWNRRQHRDQIEAIPDRLTQTYIVASAWLEQKPDYTWVKGLPCFQGIEFHKKITEILSTKLEPPDPSQLNLKLLTEDDIDFTQAVTRLDMPGDAITK